MLAIKLTKLVPDEFSNRAVFVWRSKIIYYNLFPPDLPALSSLGVSVFAATVPTPTSLCLLSLCLLRRCRQGKVADDVGHLPSLLWIERGFSICRGLHHPVKSESGRISLTFSSAVILGSSMIIIVTVPDSKTMSYPEARVNYITKLLPNVLRQDMDTDFIIVHWGFNDIMKGSSE